jgi:hypothetical protein
MAGQESRLLQVSIFSMLHNGVKSLDFNTLSQPRSEIFGLVGEYIPQINRQKPTQVSFWVHGNFSDSENCRACAPDSTPTTNAHV